MSEGFEGLGHSLHAGLGEIFSLPAGATPPPGFEMVPASELTDAERRAALAPIQGGHMAQVGQSQNDQLPGSAPIPEQPSGQSEPKPGGSKKDKSGASKTSRTESSDKSRTTDNSGSPNINVKVGGRGGLMAGVIALALIGGVGVGFADPSLRHKILKGLSSSPNSASPNAMSAPASPLSGSPSATPSLSSTAAGGLASDSGSTSPSETDSSTPSATESASPLSGPIPEYAPKPIEATTAVQGTINNLLLPITENYVAPTDKTKTVHKVSGVFAEQATGSFTITFSADAGDGKALTYDQKASNGTGLSIADFDGSKMTMTLDLSKVTTQTMIRGANNNVPASVMSQNTSPAYTFSQAAANLLTQRVIGNPSAKDAATQLGQTKELDADARDAIAALISTKYSEPLAKIVRPYIVGDVRAQQIAEKIPESNLDSDPDSHVDLTKMPDLSAQYPMAKDTNFTARGDLIALSPGTPATSKAKATPPTIDMQSMKKTN